MEDGRGKMEEGRWEEGFKGLRNKITQVSHVKISVYEHRFH